MNNSFDRLIDGMCTTLRSEVLTRLDDEFARGQVFGVINLLNTFKARADWSADFLLEQLAAQQAALHDVHAVLAQLPDTLARPVGSLTPVPQVTPIDALLAQRDQGNREIGEWLAWLDANRARIDATSAATIEQALRGAMRAEVDIELKHSPRPLFAQMSSGRDD